MPTMHPWSRTHASAGESPSVSRGPCPASLLCPPSVANGPSAAGVPLKALEAALRTRLPPDRRQRTAWRGRKGGSCRSGGGAGYSTVWRPMRRGAGLTSAGSWAATPPLSPGLPHKCGLQERRWQPQGAFVRFRNNSSRVEAVKVQRLTVLDSGVHKCHKGARSPPRPGRWHSSKRSSRPPARISPRGAADPTITGRKTW